jgi:hypothetical protein
MRGGACQSLLEQRRVQQQSVAPSASIQRPDGPPYSLARGRWEAPSWAFWAVAVAALLGSVAWLALAIRTRRTRS